MAPTTTQEQWAFLSPWTALLQEHKVRVKTEFVDHHSCRDKFKAIEVELQPSVMEEEASMQGKQQALVEALELIATALTLFPEAWASLLVDQCGCHWFKPELYDQETLLPSFELDCAFYPGEVLVAKTALRFFEDLLVSTRRTVAFQAAKQQLMTMAGGRRAVSVGSVPLKIAVSTWNELPRSFLLGHVAFVEELKRFQHNNSASWCFVEVVAFDLTGPGVSSDAAKQCQRLASDSPLVQFTRLSLDPKEVSCSSVELVELVTTLVSTTPTMHLHLGSIASDTDNYSDNHSPLYHPPRHSNDRTIRMMEAIAKVPVRIQSLSVGRLMHRASGELGRNTSVWSWLLSTLLHPSAACTIQRLELSSDCALVANDETMAKFVATVSPSHKIPTSLTLRAPRIQTATLCALMRLFGSQLHHLRISCTDHQNGTFPAPLILEACPNLKHLDLHTVPLDSLDAFCTTACRLSTLTLTNITLRDRASMNKFLVQLADPQSAPGRGLGELVLSTQDALLLGPRELTQTAQILRYNGRVHSLQLEVESSIPDRLVRNVTREHGQPAAVYEAPLALRSKLAFLSTLAYHPTAQDPPSRSKLCRDVVPLIFEFAAVCKPRWVNVIPQ